MAEWKHELNREPYELLIDGLLRAAFVATYMEEAAEHLDPPTVKAMAKAIGDRVRECLSFGQFDEEDVIAIHEEVRASMITRPDA